MNTLQTGLRLLGWPMLALLLLAQPAFAQKVEKRVAKADTTEQTVVVEIDDGERKVIVNGEVLSDEEAEHFLQEHQMEGGKRKVVIRGGPMERGFTVVGPGHGERWSPGAFVFRGDDGNVSIDEHFFNEFDFGPGEDLVWFGQKEDGPMRFRMRTSMKEHAEVAKMDMESRRLAMQVRQAEGEERARLEQELTDKLNEIFERKQELRAQHIEHLREQLEELEGTQQERQQARSEIIERRLKKLLGEDDKYDW